MPQHWFLAVSAFFGPSLGRVVTDLPWVGRGRRVVELYMHVLATSCLQAEASPMFIHPWIDCLSSLDDNCRPPVQPRGHKTANTSGRRGFRHEHGIKADGGAWFDNRRQRQNRQRGKPQAESVWHTCLHVSTRQRRYNCYPRGLTPSRWLQTHLSQLSQASDVRALVAATGRHVILSSSCLSQFSSVYS
jgi:hypothetical protein